MEADEPPVDRPVLRSSERELKAFVSSVMRGRLNEARQVIVDVLDAARFLAPWAFEFTPASSEPVDDTYLRHVRDADFVMWLAGPDATQPVINEIREALAPPQRRLIVIRYGLESRSAQCEALLAEVGLRAKYADAADSDELRSVLELTLQDEIVRALRGLPDMGRLALIQQLGQASRGRCVARWQGPGLPRGEAVALAHDASLGSLPIDCVPSAESPVVVLSSQMGAGKSLAADRHLQAALDRLLTDGSSPVPVWLTAGQARGGLLTAAMAACEGIGDPRVQGGAIVVDGLDEAGVEVAKQLLNEARELTIAWPQTTVLLTTRPIPSIDEVEERRYVPELDEDSVSEIVSIGTGGVASGSLWSLPEGMRESLGRPLFALLYGLKLRDNPAMSAPQSRGDLLAFLGDRAAATAGAEAQSVLRSLSVKSIERELGPVPSQEIGAPNEVSALMAGGLVVKGPSGLAPSLPVIAQWFAAQALLLGEVSIEDLLSRPEDIDLWLYPIAIAVTTGSQQQGAGLLEPVMRELPSFAFTVMGEALGTAGFDGVPAPPWRDAGQQMRTAMQTMADSLGVLGRLTLPIDSDGRIFPIAVATAGSRVSYAIWKGNEPRDAVHAMPTQAEAFDVFPGYGLSGGGEIGRGSSWAWRWARERLRHGLQPLVDHKLLPSKPDGVIAQEQAWRVACLLSNLGGFFAEPIELAPILERLDFTIELARQHGTSGDVFIRVDGENLNAVRIRHAFARLRVRDAEVRPPHPGPDLREQKGPGLVGFYFSDERLIEHTRSVYGKAIEAYQELVEVTFVSIVDRLAHHVTFPARYEGTINPNREPESGAALGLPVISGYFEPLALDEPSQVELQISNQRVPLGMSAEALENLRRLRPGASRWITAWGGSGVLALNGRAPSTGLAYKWLWQDLSYIRLVTGTQPGAGRLS
jgi:hypothetical protein